MQKKLKLAVLALCIVSTAFAQNTKTSEVTEKEEQTAGDDHQGQLQRKDRPAQTLQLLRVPGARAGSGA